MKKLLLSAFLIAGLSLHAQQKNTLLNAEFWKSSPDINAVKAEIEKGNNPVEFNPMMFDATTMAINNNANTDVIKYLLEQPGNNISKLTHDGRIYLHWAANKGNVELVEYLIAQGSDINLEDSHGTTPIVFAIGNGQTNTTVYDAFFKAGLNPKKTYKDGASLLLLAIPNDKDLSLAKYFTAKGLSIKDTDSNGNTAFNYACRTGNVELLKKLLTEGVKYTDNALIMAAQGTRRTANTIEVYKYLVEDLKIKPAVVAKDGENVLHFIVRKQNQADIITYFMAKGVDVNKADNEGNTPLINAGGTKETANAQTLLPKVTNINAVNAKGASALARAVESGSPEMVTLLLNNKANINIQDKEGNNLAYYLVQSYREPRGGAKPGEADDFSSKLTILQQNKLDLTTPQAQGNTLYHLAVTKGEFNLLKKLEPLKIDINAQNKEGLTALHKAAMVAKDDSVLKYLVSIGAKTGIKTEFDETAYSLAGENEVLQKNKVSVDFLK